MKNPITETIKQGREEFEREQNFWSRNETLNFLQSQQLALIRAIKENLPKEIENNKWSEESDMGFSGCCGEEASGYNEYREKMIKFLFEAEQELSKKV